MMIKVMMGAVCVLLLSSTAAAQTYTAQFNASADHNAIQNQVAVVSSYILSVYAPGGTNLVATQDLGKPVPDSSNVIAVDVAATMIALPASTSCDISAPTISSCYSATVKAVGPGGEGVSPVSPPFTLVPKAPVAPQAPTVRRQ